MEKRKKKEREREKKEEKTYKQNGEGGKKLGNMYERKQRDGRGGKKKTLSRAFVDSIEWKLV